MITAFPLDQSAPRQQRGAAVGCAVQAIRQRVDLIPKSADIAAGEAIDPALGTIGLEAALIPAHFAGVLVGVAPQDVRLPLLNARSSALRAFSATFIGSLHLGDYDLRLRNQRDKDQIAQSTYQPYRRDVLRRQAGTEAHALPARRSLAD